LQSGPARRALSRPDSARLGVRRARPGVRSIAEIQISPRWCPARTHAPVGVRAGPGSTPWARRRADRRSDCSAGRCTTLATKWRPPGKELQNRSDREACASLTLEKGDRREPSSHRQFDGTGDWFGGAGPAPGWAVSRDGARTPPPPPTPDADFQGEGRGIPAGWAARPGRAHVLAARRWLSGRCWPRGTATKSRVAEVDQAVGVGGASIASAPDARWAGCVGWRGGPRSGPDADREVESLPTRRRRRDTAEIDQLGISGGGSDQVLVGRTGKVDARRMSKP